MARARTLRDEEGSALTEAALITPVLILLVFWSSAVTDVMVLKIKAQEAARFALWELTVFRDQAQIKADVQARFADLKSPATVATTTTGLMTYPKSSDLSWNVNINPQYQKVSLGGRYTSNPSNSNSLSGILLGFVSQVAALIAPVVDSATQAEHFNEYGSGSVTVSLAATHNANSGSIILNGGDLSAHNSGGQDFSAENLKNYLLSAPLSSEKPMQLIYDSWKAWPKPAYYTTVPGASGALVDPTVSPNNTYPVVESMVSQQVNQIAFFGLNSISFFNTLNQFLGKLLSSGISQSMLGGDPPTFFATTPMDHAIGTVTQTGPPGNRGNFPIGPITILPVGAPDSGFVPGGGLITNRLGDQGTSNTSVFTVDDNNGVGAGSDVSRYTLPYRINTKYWTADGGVSGGASGKLFGSSVTTISSTIGTNNNYVIAYGCRGHYFAGSTKPQITNPQSRYTAACPY